MSQDEGIENESDIDEEEDEEEDDGEYWLTQLPPKFKELYFITREAMGLKNSSDVRRRMFKLAALREALFKDATYVNTIFRMHGNRCTLLNEAARETDPVVVDILLEYDADPNLLCGSPDALHTCIFSVIGTHWDRIDNLAIALSLVTHGLDTNMIMPQTDGMPNRYSTALHQASEGGNYEVVEMLLDHKANVHALDNEGRTPIVMAVSPANHTRNEDQVLHTIQTLVMHGANLHAIDKFGQTLLHNVAKWQCREGYCMKIVQYLVDHGVSDIRDLNGRTAGDLAIDEYSFNRHVLRLSRLFGTRLESMLQARQRSIVAFALGNRGQATFRSNYHKIGAHDWRSRGF